MWIDLPSGAKADLEAPDVLRSKHTRAITRAVSNMAGRRIGEIVSDITDGAFVVVVKDWTCVGEDGNVLPIPSVDMNSLDDLDPRDYDVMLNDDATGRVTREYIALRTERVSPDDHADPASPTAPSDASGPALREEPSPSTEIAGPIGTTPQSTWLSPIGGAGLQTR